LILNGSDRELKFCMWADYHPIFFWFQVNDNIMRDVIGENLF